MLDISNLAQIFAVLCCGLFSGAALYINLVEHPARMECGTQLAATEFGPSYSRAARLQATLVILGSLSATLVWIRGGSVAWLWGAVLFFCIVPYTLLVILSTNKQLLDASLDRSSARAHALLVRWNLLHGLRTVTSLVVFIFFVLLRVTGK